MSARLESPPRRWKKWRCKKCARSYSSPLPLSFPPLCTNGGKHLSVEMDPVGDPEGSG